MSSSLFQFEKTKKAKRAVEGGHINPREGQLLDPKGVKINFSVAY